MKLGKLPARAGAIKFKFSTYADTRALPKPPAVFGHDYLISPRAWGMLANDKYGCCVWSGAAHETMLWNREAHHPVTFNNTAVLLDYAAVTGFNPDDPNTDQGTDVQQAASYRRKVGVIDGSGKRHKIAAYLAIDPGNLTEIYQAMWLFGAVGVGIQFPSSAMDQFNRGLPWSPVTGSPIEGGHYVCLTGKQYFLHCVTWGKLQQMTIPFLQKYNDETVAYVSLEALTNNKSPEGFDAATLLADLNQLETMHASVAPQTDSEQLDTVGSTTAAVADDPTYGLFDKLTFGGSKYMEGGRLRRKDK